MNLGRLAQILSAAFAGWARDVRWPRFAALAGAVLALAHFGWGFAGPALATDSAADFDGSVIVWSNDAEQMLDVQVDVVTESWAIESKEIGGLQVTIGWGDRFGENLASASSRWLVALTGDARLDDVTIMGPDIERETMAPEASGVYNGEPAQFYSGNGPRWTMLRGIPQRRPVVVAQERTTVQLPSVGPDFILSLAGSPGARTDLPVPGRWFEPQTSWYQVDSGVKRSSSLRIEDAIPAEGLISDTALIWGSDQALTPSAALVDVAAEETVDREVFLGALLLGAAVPLAVEALLELVTSGSHRDSRARVPNNPSARRRTLRSTFAVPAWSAGRLKHKDRPRRGRQRKSTGSALLARWGSPLSAKLLRILSSTSSSGPRSRGRRP